MTEIETTDIIKEKVASSGGLVIFGAWARRMSRSFSLQDKPLGTESSGESQDSLLPLIKDTDSGGRMECGHDHCV